MMEKSGRLQGALKPRLSQPSSFVMTQESLISLPDAARVRMVPTGSAFSGTRFLELNSHGSQSLSAPAAAALAESRTLPPPTARIMSTFSARASSAALRAIESLGFASTPPSSTNSTPLSLSAETTVS